MINLYNARIDALSVHKVGNKSKNEPLFLSKKQLQIDNEQSGILKEFFLKNFREKEEIYYHFHHDVDIELHDMYNIISDMIETPERIHDTSKKIATALYQCANHHHIKSGEVYTVSFSDLVIDGETVSGVGIFKSESKQDFLLFEQSEEDIYMDIIQGISTSKLDKGCLVFDVEKENGYKILSIDNNRYDAKYWLEQFLEIKPLQNDSFFTKHYLKFCQNFAKDVILPTQDKQQEVLFMNRTMNHFAKNDTFEEDAYLNEVVDSPERIPEFKMYKEEKGPKYNVEDVSNFSIENATVNKVKKSISNTINLDTNIQIKMNFVNPESVEKFIEKGWDEEKQMYYYLLYFNKEQKSQ